MREVEPGTVLLERFEVRRRAGAGGMGTVYLGLDRRTGEPVALKLLHSTREHEELRFRREARLLSRVQHPRVVRFVASGTTEDGVDLLVMEWLEGPTLEEHLQGGRMSPGSALRLLRLLAEALAALHAVGITHRDVKPRNVVLAQGRLEGLRLLDLGIAHDEESTGLTGSGAILGTPAYMSPEQAMGHHETSPRSDLFSLGVVAFEALLGRVPFEGAHPVAVLAKVVLEEPPRLEESAPELPPALCALVHRLLSKDPALRPADGSALLALLEDLELPAGRLTLTSLLPPALTAREMRLVCLLLSADVSAQDPTHTAPTARLGPLRAAQARARALVEAAGGRFEALASGGLLMHFSGAASAADLAARAARCALELRAALPSLPLALCTGRAPASEREPVGAVIDRLVALLRSAGPRPPGLPVDELTAGLLGAEFRLSRAQDLWLLEGERDPDAAALRPVQRRSTPLVGRERELALLEATARECGEERSVRAVLVTGAPGSGKSRLRRELAGRLDAARETLLSARGQPELRAAPYGLLARALRRALDAREDEPAARTRARVEQHLGSLLAREEAGTAAEFLCELLGTPREEPSPELRAARSDPRLMGDRKRYALLRWLEAEALRRPLTVLLDDLHCADPPSLALLEQALEHARREGELPLLVVGFARPELLERSPELWRNVTPTILPLAPLHLRAAERLVRGALGPEAPEGSVRWCVRYGEGNPLALEELARAAQERAPSPDAPAPPTVLAMVQARLEALEPEARRLLRAASVFGPTFWPGAVRALLVGALDEAALERWLSVLCERDLLEPAQGSRFAQERQLAFRNSVHREAAYEMLTEQDRALGHRLAARWLAQAGERDALVLATHLERGGLPAEAIELYLRAARQALEGNDLEAAVLHASAALRCGARGEERGLAWLLCAEAHRWGGRFAEGARAGEEALRDLSPQSASWYAAVAETAVCLAARDERAKVVTLARDLAEAPTPPELRSARVIALSRTATQVRAVGEPEHARHLLESLGAVEPSQDALAAARVAEAHAMQAHLDGDSAGFLLWSRRAVAAYEAQGNVRSSSMVRGNTGFALAELGALEEAARVLRRSLEEAVALRSTLLEGYARHNLGLALALAGELEAAAAEEQRACSLFASVGNARLAGASRLYLAYAKLRASRFDDALAAAREALQALEAIPTLAAPARAVLALALLQRDPAEALEEARRAASTLRAAGGADTLEALVPLALHRALRAAGHEEEASAVAREAQRALLERAERIADAGLRESFLHAVPPHAETLALA